MGILIHLVSLLARHRFLVLAAFLLAVFSGTTFTNFVGSPPLGAWLLYCFGQTAEAQVTGNYATLINTNDRNVIGYNVIVRQADGHVISTAFEDEFNIFPPQSCAYPQPDETFDVRYLPDFSRDFVIVTDDASVWHTGSTATFSVSD